MKRKHNILMVLLAFCAGGVVASSAVSIPQEEISGASREMQDETVTVKFDSGQLAKAATDGIGSPELFNFESVKVQSVQATGGEVTAKVTKVGDRVTARLRGDKLFEVRVKGVGDRDSKLDVQYNLSGLDATVDMSKREAEVEATLRIRNHESTRMWTRAKKKLGMTFRVTAIPKPFHFNVKVSLLVKVLDDGRVVLVPKSWTPANKEDKIDIKISGQKLPDGWATIKPIDAESVQIDMDIPFGAGDRTIKNPLRHAIDKVMGREFFIGSLPK